MALLEFSYDGYQKAIIARQNCIVKYTLVGGGGGGGGPDTYAGGNGLKGNQINGYIALNKGDTIYCTVGQGGRGGGAQGTNRAGGLGGYGLNGFSGGTGGRSGGSGSSGAGGGGGAATVLSFDGAGNDPIAIAAGGGAGGGGGDKGGPVTYSTSAYGDTGAYSLAYYSNGATDNAWSGLLNSYSIWNGNGTYTWEVYFPETLTYTFSISIDNTGGIYLDDTLVVATTGSEGSRYSTTFSADVQVTKGWHIVKMTATNWGGPAALGGFIKFRAANKIQTLWTTRDANNQLSSTINLGRGGHGNNYSGDGGGAGGGGGGHRGGRGGSTRRGDVGGYSGSVGYNYNSNATTSVVGSPSDKGAGGLGRHRSVGGGENAGDGYAAFEAIHTDTYVRQSSSWKRVEAVYERRSFSFLGINIKYWSKIPTLYVAQDGVWKQVYGDSQLTYYSTFGTLNNTSGPYPG